jgi:hypothetical protein
MESQYKRVYDAADRGYAQLLQRANSMHEAVVLQAEREAARLAGHADRNCCTLGP